MPIKKRKRHTIQRVRVRLYEIGCKVVRSQFIEPLQVRDDGRVLIGSTWYHGETLLPEHNGGCQRDVVFLRMEAPPMNGGDFRDSLGVIQQE